MLRGIIHFFCLFAALIICAEPLDVELFAKSAILINADNGVVLFEKNSKAKLFPASTTKIATTLYILERKKDYLNQSFTASDEILKQMSSAVKKNNGYKIGHYLLEPDGSTFEIIQGETLALRSLLYGVMIRSGNDAANMVAEATAGSVSNFMRELNIYLKEIGCLDTNFCNPHGLHHPDHFSTAFDLSLMMKMALKNPEFKKIIATKTFFRPKTNKQEKKSLDNFIHLLKPGRYFYPFMIGGKTGYHSEAKYNLVAVAQKEERKLIAVVMGCNKLQERYQDAILLFEKAFAEKKKLKKILGKEVEFQAKIEGASNILSASLQKDLYYEYYPSEELKLKAYIYWFDIEVPLPKGSKVGEVRLTTVNDQLIKTMPVFANTELKRSFFYFLKNLFK